MPRSNKKKKKQKQKKKDNAIAIGSNDNTVSSSEAASSTTLPDRNAANTHIKIIIIKYEDSEFALLRHIMLTYHINIYLYL